MKRYFKKNEPVTIEYRDLKNFDPIAFREDLRYKPLVLMGKNFLSLAADWDLLGIWSGRKYVRTKEIVRRPQAPIKKIQISSTLALSS